jgi:Shikimate dehydrogenase substrate binding domain
MGYDGLNITFPCKQAVMPVLYELSGDAADHQPQSVSVGGPPSRGGLPHIATP